MKNYVLCLKHGTKYSADYVNKLYNMVCRHLTIDFEFVCMTEDSTGINPSIKTLPLPTETNVKGWWYKPMVFNPNLGLEGTILFLDLDIIVFDNIDKLFSYEPDKFCIIKDYYLKRRGKQGMNSSCFRFDSNTNRHVYTEFMKRPDSYMKRLAGDQDLFNELITENYCYWPEDWILSYKWEMFSEKDMKKTSNNMYVVNGSPITNNESCIGVFHGVPNPHQIVNKWCNEHWR